MKRWERWPLSKTFVCVCVCVCPPIPHCRTQDIFVRLPCPSGDSRLGCLASCVELSFHPSPHSHTSPLNFSRTPSPENSALSTASPPTPTLVSLYPFPHLDFLMLLSSINTLLSSSHLDPRSQLPPTLTPPSLLSFHLNLSKLPPFSLFLVSFASPILVPDSFTLSFPITNHSQTTPKYISFYTLNFLQHTTSFTETHSSFSHIYKPSSTFLTVTIALSSSHFSAHYYYTPSPLPSLFVRGGGVGSEGRSRKMILLVW